MFLFRSKSASGSASRIVALLLLISLGTAWPGAEAWAQPSVSPVSHPAACHSHHPTEHPPATPAKMPASFQCCANGHDVAIPIASFSLRPMSRPVSAFDALAVAPPVFFRLLREEISPSSASPPASVPLRV
jgi:hypothetical protein